MKRLFLFGLMAILIGLLSFNAFSSDQYAIARNQYTGEVCGWLASHFWVNDNRVCYGIVDLGWEIISKDYDWDGNGTNDILWRHKLTGEFYVWSMDGFQILYQGFVWGPMDQNWIIN